MSKNTSDMSTVNDMDKYTVYPCGSRWAVRGDSSDGFGDTLHRTFDEAVEEAEFQKKKDAEEAARKNKLEERERLEKENEKAQIASYQGFLDASPMAAGKRRKVLERLVQYCGGVMTRKTFIEMKISQGWFVRDNRLTDGVLFNTVTQTELNYAKHLINLQSEKET